MNNMNSRGETATQAYARNMTDIFGKLEALKTHLTDKSVDCTTANWGHVGSAVHINELLSELCEFVGVEL